MSESNKFVVKHKDLEPKEEKTVTMTLRISKDLLWDYDELADKSGRSRNEVMNMALKYAIDHLKLLDKE